MKSQKLFLIFGLFALGCTAPAEQLEVPPVPVVDETSLAFPDVLTRARLQATGATEAFYLDNWAKLQAAASSLEATATLLPKSEGVPAAKKKAIEENATKLGNYARQLGEAARAQDATASTDRLQKIGLLVRQLRLE